MARMNLDRQKLLFLIMRHAGGFVINANINNQNNRIRVNNETARNLIGLDLDGNNRNNFEINGFNKDANPPANLDAATNVDLQSNELNVPNVGGQDANLNEQLTYINCLLGKIDVDCMDKDTLERLKNAGFAVTNSRDEVTGLKINPNNDNNALTTNHIDDELKKLFLALPDLQYVHRKQMLDDPQLKREIDKKRANYYSKSDRNVATDNAVTNKINASLNYSGINTFFNKSKATYDPHLKTITEDNPIINNGLTQIGRENDGTLNTINYIQKSTDITNNLNSTHNNYSVQINRTDNHNDYQDYNVADQNSAFTKNFRDWMLEKFAAVLKTKTDTQVNNFKQRLYRINGDAADQNARPPKPQAAVNKANINYILEALGDKRLHIKGQDFTNEHDAKTKIQTNLSAIIKDSETLASRKLLKSRFLNPIPNKSDTSLFKLYTEDLDSEAAAKEEIKEFFSERLPALQGKGILEKYTVYQKDLQGRLVEMSTRDNNGRVPENARHSIVKTSMTLKAPLENINYDESAGNSDNEPNRYHHKIHIDRYHQSHGTHKKNTYDVRFTDQNNKPISSKNIKFADFLKIAACISPKHNVIKINEIPDKLINITLPTIKSWGKAIFVNNERQQLPYYPIPAKWVMYAALKIKNFEGNIDISPASLRELGQTQGPLADKIKTLIHHYRPHNPENDRQANISMNFTN